MKLLLKGYLALYNLASAAGWAYVLFLCYTEITAGHSAAQLWETLERPLTVVQTAAWMEVVHSLLGFVSSPVFTVYLQVQSRILLVWGFTRAYADCQAHWSLYQMVISWGLVEVPRYLFYVFAQLPIEMPFPLFWLRYSLFMVLYPTGISGEWMQMLFSLSASATSSPVWHRFTLFTMYVLYTLGGPFMILNMWGNRKSAFKKRAAASKKTPVRAPAGLQWPITNAKSGERSSSTTNKAIWVAALGAVSKAAEEKAVKTKNWRHGYVKHVEASLTCSLKSSEDAVNMAQAGIRKARELFTFVDGDKEINFQEALDKCRTSFLTMEIAGTASPSPAVMEVPYGGKDPTQPYYKYKNNKDVLSHAALVKQIEAWEAYGTIESSCADALKAVVKNQSKWLDLSDRYFVLLGATSAMGPLDFLLKYGANIVCVDIDRPNVWKTLIDKARKSSGRIIFPVQESKLPAGKFAKDLSSLCDSDLAQCAGANLFEHAPQLCNWVAAVCPGKALTIGNYTYLDGELHVRLSMACDAIIEHLCCQRKNTSIAFLCTPTDVHVIPQSANKAARENAERSPWWQKLIATLPGRMLTKNALKPVQTERGRDIYYVDGISSAQGPNYALAKRMQHWRCVLAREAGHTVSTNIAPSTSTASVVSNPLFAAAYGGMHLFKPMEVMYQETSNAVMGALLLHDVVNPDAPANPKCKTVVLENPYQLFEYSSFHGGVWRCAYKLDTIGEVSALAYFAAKFAFQAIAVLGVLTALVYWVATGVPKEFTLLDAISDKLRSCVA